MALAGVLKCNTCADSIGGAACLEHETWSMADRFDCPKCLSYGRPVDDIIDGVPSKFCPGHVPRVAVKKQRGLFDE